MPWLRYIVNDFLRQRPPSSTSMATKSSRSAVSLSRQALRHYRAQNGCPVNRPLASTSTSTSTSTCSRTFATSPCRASEAAAAERPRWSYTPERMKAPFSPHITKNPARSRWRVNEDPQKLDNALNAFLGRDGERMLPEELKWLAVTHKSFDQGRRGFNDRLAFLGRQICNKEAMESIITSPPKYENMPADPYAEKRQPFEDPGLRGLDNLSDNQPNDIFTPEKLTKLAMDTGLVDVVRWKPRMPENEEGSGLNIVMSGAVYSLIGAVALQSGGKAAGRIVREKIMKRLRS
ncbi:RNase III domain-containing protein [Xylaria venustula]|nr:RNase III domain-containing protein [Xylaria venustula]